MLTPNLAISLGYYEVRMKHFLQKCFFLLLKVKHNAIYIIIIKKLHRNLCHKSVLSPGMPATGAKNLEVNKK